MAVIDADAHVVETERTWEYMDEAEHPFKPEVVVPKAGGDREYWLIEGRAFAKNRNRPGVLVDRRQGFCQEQEHRQGYA